MKVYAIIELFDWDNSQLKSIWSTRELAEKRIAELEKDPEYSSSSFEIEEHWIDGRPF
jgi:hypothetical protein